MKAKIQIVFSMLLFSMSVFAQFKTSTTYRVSVTGASMGCRIGGYVIVDSGPLTGLRNAGRQLCSDLGILPRGGFTQTTTIGTFWRHNTQDVATTNCATRSSGSAAGSVTCQSSYTGN